MQLSTRARVLAGGAARARAARVVPRAQAGTGPLKRPELKRPESPAPAAPAPVEQPPAAAQPAAAEAPASAAGGVTIEYQRQRAKEMRKYFEDAKLEQLTTKSQVFGWTPSNEIGNGRWVMFGFVVGMMTELATGVDFIHQLEQIVTYTGLWDFE